ncbi:MAG: hypothetical protein GY796_22320 [Chloroflexi bacterium]|nr:hypothetical protein [Chloroflexota bacterium]
MVLVKIKVRPQQTVTFPGICSHCGRPAPYIMPVKKRISRITRLIGVPVCTDCAAHINYKSAAEERLQKMDWLISGAVFLLLLGIGLLVAPASLPFLLRLLMVGLGTIMATTVTHAFFKRQIRKTYLPPKQAVLNAARIENFTWRATTFAFENETFSQRFREINEPLLMEI